MRNDNAKPDPYLGDGFQVINPFKKMYRFYRDMPGVSDKEKFAWLGLKCGFPLAVIVKTLRMSKETVMGLKKSFDSPPTEPPEKLSDVD